MAISPAQAVKELRELTGLGMMECKKLLDEAGNDFEKAKKAAIERGGKKIEKVAGRETSEGIVYSYIHHNQKVGVMIELNCNTDFVARNESFRQLAHDLAMHITAMKPEVVRRDEVDQELVAGVRRHLSKEVGEGKPANVVEKIVDGKMRSWYEERVLLDQPFAKDGSKTIQKLIEEEIGKTGENIAVSRFVRFEVGAKPDAEDEAESKT